MATQAQALQTGLTPELIAQADQSLMYIVTRPSTVFVRGSTRRRGVWKFPKRRYGSRRE